MDCWFWKSGTPQKCSVKKNQVEVPVEISQTRKDSGRESSAQNARLWSNRKRKTCKFKCFLFSTCTPN